MQWYVYLVTISATAALSWFASELLSQPLRAFFELRRKVLGQMSVAKTISFPKPRELAVSSQEIRDYDQALRNVREAQRAFSNLGFRLLAFGENEPVASNVLVAIGLNPVAAGSRLIELSMAYSRPHMDRADLCNQVEKALRSNRPAPPRARKWATGSSFRAPATAELWRRKRRVHRAMRQSRSMTLQRRMMVSTL